MTVSDKCYIETENGVIINPITQLISNEDYKITLSSLVVSPDDSIILSEDETRCQIVLELNIEAKSAMVFAIFAGDRIFGCIQVINKRVDDFFDMDDLYFAEKLAKFASEMFVKYGILKAERNAGAEEVVLFSDLIRCGDYRKMEAILKTVDEVRDLNADQQNIAVYHMKKVFDLFNK